MTSPSTADLTEPRDLLPAAGQQSFADRAEIATPAGPEPSADDRPALLPFYVYELRDPRNNEVFYVGKGTGLRLDAHGPGSEDAKRLRIADIVAAGLEVTRIVIGRFETEAEAFAVESVLIKWVYGFANLTNQVHGHGGQCIRGWEHRASTEPISGLDVERPPPGVRDGRFTAEQRERIERHDIVEKMEALRHALANAEQLRGRGLEFEEVDASRSGDPGMRVTGFSPYVHMKVDMQLTGDRVKLGLIPAGRDHLEAFNHALTSIREPFRISNVASPSRYTHTADFVSRGPWRRGIPHESTDEIIAHIEQTLARLTDVARPVAPS